MSPPTRKDKQEGYISSVFSTFSGKKSAPLPDRFRDLKRHLTTGLEEEIQKLWDDLVETLKVRTEEVATKRESIIPQLKFADLKAGSVSPANIEAIRRTGVAVIRGVMPKDVATGLLSDTLRAPPHVDGGGIGRWEDRSYNHVYRKIFQGKWQEYDPWDLTGRLDANMNIHEGPRGCSVFRTFPSWLGLSRHGPQQGTLVVHPILQPTTAYWMLRPFFKPIRKGSLDGWKFSLDDGEGDVYLHGAKPGTAQEHTPDHRPHLRLCETMIPYPTVESGDTVFWSADTIHGTEAVNTGDNDACVFYIPSVPLDPNNAQRDAFMKGIPPPDFPGGLGESQFSDRASVKDVQTEAGKMAMGLSPIKLNGKSEKSIKIKSDINKTLGY
ncbi:uncharacterized protein N7477_002886 [Penicillium maclennaniae]|uniref:uncharacterized protein n=1 Tax=Penicillium maclennaniae TaxID=1343394 RepID=UPI002540B6EC|nr:uncharacterized protein N7477_002886 [Penicillium maclennaniae]KAJ5677253.1 hypothetical protein N7477_002886 [Penicillium maclennaniae]